MKDAIWKNMQFYKNKPILITGHTGFKGAWLTAVLHYLGAKALGYALAPEKGCLYEKMQGNDLLENVTGDLLDYDLLKDTVQRFKPEIVIHLAAFGFMKECFDDPIRAYQTNLLGSVNLLEVLKDCSSVKSIVMVSTDKVYENKGDGAVYTEEDELGGMGPYAGSKTCMEFMIKDYQHSYFQTGEREVGIAAVRASNVLAGGDHIQTRLIPSILRAVADGTPVELRNPMQTRPWQSVLDALNGYLTIGRYLYEDPVGYSGAWNIGPTPDGIRPVSWVFEKIQESFQNLEGKKGDHFLVNESETLGLDITKALNRLDWKPILSCDRVIEQVVDFFQSQQRGENEYQICLRQIAEFYGEVK